MKSPSFAVVALFLFVLSATGQLSESFDSRGSIQIAHLRPYLQNKCWILKNAEIKALSSAAGDGAIVMRSGTSGNAEVYTPYLKIDNQLSVSFLYRSISSAESNGASIQIFLSDENHLQTILLEKISFITADENTLKTYEQTFTNLTPGIYKLMISYVTDGANTAAVIDQISFSAPLLYQSGCNTAPVAFNDFIVGNRDRSARGKLTTNDRDANGHRLNAYITFNSPDGEVSIYEDNTFTFIPNESFDGNKTQFRYRVCDNAANPLCSDEATVTINFPEAGVFSALKDFTGNYLGNGSIELNWSMSHEKTPFRISIERSIDGDKWEKSGEVQSIGIKNSNLNYKYVDRVGKNIANKNDLYYRLKFIDSDQEIAMSKLLVVRVYNTAFTKMISITPNPVKKDIGVQLQLNSNAVVVMKVIDNNGVEIMRKSHRSIAGTNSYIIDGSAAMKPGLYLLEIIINSKERMLVKLLKD